MVALLFADADEDRDVRAEVGGFEASPADADADAMAEAEVPALMPSMASLAPRRGTAELSTAPFPFRPFLFFSFFFGETESYFSIQKSSQTKRANSSVQHPKRAQFECTEKPRCRKWPHLRDQRVNERLPSNAIFGRPRTGAGAEGVREASGASRRRRRGA